MTVIEKLSAIWREDHLLRRIVKNSSHLFSSNVISSGLIFMQGIVAVRLIGVTNWGLIYTVQLFASNINRLLSFRMSEVVVKHLGAALGQNKKQEAAVLVKAAGLTEVSTSLVGLLVLVLLAPWAAVTFAKDASTARWFLLYGLILVSNLVAETSTGVLQTAHRFDRLARINLAQSIITASMIAITYAVYRVVGYSLYPHLVPVILLAYVTGKTYVGVSTFVLAARELNDLLGAGWWRAPLKNLPGKRSLAFFAVNTNLNGTVNLIFRDNVQLYMAALLSTTEVGYFKIAMSLIVPLTMILDPLIAPTYAEISRTVAKFEWETTLRLLKRVTAITAGVVAAFWSFWALTGWWIIPLIYKAQARPVYPTLLVLLLGYGFASIFQWNRSLLLSLGKAGYPVLVSVLVGMIELALIFLLVPRYGYLMMAAILSGYFIITIGVMVLRGLQEVGRQRSAMSV